MIDTGLLFECRCCIFMKVIVQLTVIPEIHSNPASWTNTTCPLTPPPPPHKNSISIIYTLYSLLSPDIVMRLRTTNIATKK